MKFSDPASARTINRLRVLNLVRTEGTLSRADIARALDLNKPSTGEIVACLIEEGLLQEGGKVETTGGRRPTAIILDHDAATVLGVELGSLSTAFSLSDLKGNILRYERLPTPAEPDAKEWGQRIIKTCMKLTANSPSPTAGIVIATAATLSEDKKTIVSHERWPWTDIPLAEAIEHHTKLPTIIIHSVEAMVKAEQYFGEETCDALFYVNWAQHINAAWVNQATISSERTKFGHLAVSSTGLCRCGGIGCLETVASGWALKELSGGLTAKQLNQQSAANPLLEEACKAMGSALVSATAITGAKKIVLGGGISNLDDRYISIIQSHFEQHAHHELVATPIVRSALQEHSSSLGAVAVALDQWVFRHSILKTLQNYEKPLPRAE